MIRKILIGGGALMLSAVLYGQPRTDFGGPVFQFAGTGGQEIRAVFGMEGIGSAVVTGKPFSATEERHSLQTLGDGTRIESTETNRLFRDEQGRTRIERNGGNITIYDPVAGFNAELNPTTRTASKLTVVVREGRMVGRTGGAGNITFSVDTAEGQKNKLAKLREESAQLQRQYGERYPAVVETKAQIADLEKASAAHPAMLPPVMIQGQAGVATAGVPAQLDYAQFVTTEDGPKKVQTDVATTGPVTFAYSTAGASPLVLREPSGDNASVESLPSQMVNGALAQGTRTTETIPVGKIGNDRVLSVVNERWFSNDLQLLVKSSSSDPRFGNTTYQLTNIVQASPDPSLFQIPGDYTIRK